MGQQRRRDLKREQFWRRAVWEWEKSGQTIRAYCASRHLREPSFYAWRRALRQGGWQKGSWHRPAMHPGGQPIAQPASGLAARSASRSSRSGTRCQASLRQGAREAAKQAARQATLVPLRVVADQVLEVVLPAGVVVRVPSGAEAAAVCSLLVKLVAALRSASC